MSGIILGLNSKLMFSLCTDSKGMTFPTVNVGVGLKHVLDKAYRIGKIRSAFSRLLLIVVLSVL